MDGLDEREYRLLQSRRAGNMHGCDESSPPVPLYEARRAATIPQWDFDGVDTIIDFYRIIAVASSV